MPSQVAGAQRALRLQRADERLERGVEGHTEGVADRFENVAALFLKGPAHHLVVGGEGHAHGVGVLFPFFGTAFDIGEKECDGSGRQSGHGETECVRP